MNIDADRITRLVEVAGTVGSLDPNDLQQAQRELAIVESHALTLRHILVPEMVTALLDATRVMQRVIATLAFAQRELSAAASDSDTVEGLRYLGSVLPTGAKEGQDG